MASQTTGNFYVVDPVTGSNAIVSSGGLLENPSHVLIDADGGMLVAERTGTPGIVRTDPENGQQHLIAAGPMLSFPVALTFDLQSDLIVGDSQSGLVRVDQGTATA